MNYKQYLPERKQCNEPPAVCADVGCHAETYNQALEDVEAKLPELIKAVREDCVEIVKNIKPPLDPHGAFWKLGFCRARQMAVKALTTPLKVEDKNHGVNLNKS